MAKILLCGASDLKTVSKQFEKVVRDFNGQPMCFVDASINYSNNRNWAKNSEDSVKQADIVVLVIVERYGKITWEIEYKAAIKHNKKIIIFCYNDLHTSFRSVGTSLTKKHPHHEIFSWIHQLDRFQKTIVPYDYTDFGDRLKEQIGKIYDEALAKSQKRPSVVPENGDKKFLLAENSFISKVEELMGRYHEGFEDSVKKIALDSNNKLRNFAKLGVYNAYENLQILKIFDLVNVIAGDQFRIMRIYLSDLELKIVKNSLKEYIKSHDCSFRIILLSPTQKETIKRRIKHTNQVAHHDLAHYIKEITGQLETFHNIKNELRDSGSQDRLQVRVHEDFVSCAMVGYKDEILYSNYIHGKYSDETVQLRVKGKNTNLYQELSTHFELQWKHAFDYTVENHEITIIRDR